MAHNDLSLLSDTLFYLLEKKNINDQIDKNSIQPPLPIRVEPNSISYTARHRGTWFKPEYDFKEIQVAQDTDGYLFQSIKKKVNKIIVAGCDFVGHDPEAVKYIKTRILEIGYAINKPFIHLIWETVFDLARFNNCMWVKVRDEESSSGEPITDTYGRTTTPIAAYFILPFETLEFKSKVNGELKKVLQRIDGKEKEWAPRDLVHFTVMKKPGFLVATPEVLPALDDLAILRRMEEEVEELVESNLFPTFQYKVGTENSPARTGPDGINETDIVKKTIQYMPSGGIYVTDYRHSIEAIGAQGKALVIDSYLTHFKNRALSSMGSSALDMGEGGDATKSSASTMSKGMMMDVEALSIIVSSFIDFFVISELLLEGGYDPLNEEEMVHLKFGVIDKEEKRADENQQIQMYHGNIKTIDEVRKEIGHTPWTNDHTERSFYKMYEEPNNLLKAMGAGTAASGALAEHPSSNVEPKHVKAEEQFAKAQAKEANRVKMMGRPTAKTKASGSNRTSSSKARPSNQHGTRSSTKTTHDVEILDFENNLITIACDFEPDTDKITMWKNDVYKEYENFNGKISIETIAETKKWRLK